MGRGVLFWYLKSKQRNKNPAGDGRIFWWSGMGFDLLVFKRAKKQVGIVDMAGSEVVNYRYGHLRAKVRGKFDSEV